MRQRQPTRAEIRRANSWLAPPPTQSGRREVPTNPLNEKRPRPAATDTTGEVEKNDHAFYRDHTDDAIR